MTACAKKADIASIGRVAFVMVVNPAFAAKTVPELIGNAKANPGKINMATVGPGSPVQIDGRCGSSHGELSRYRASVARSHQRPGGSHFHVYCLDNRVHQVRRPLAVMSAQQTDLLPDVRSIGEFVSSYDTAGWVGLTAPANTPPEIVASTSTLMLLWPIRRSKRR